MRIDPLPPLALYVHLPWCVHKCPYCDFNSFELRGAIQDSAYVDALLRDLESERELISGRTVTSVFIGGGTPSLFDGSAIQKFLDGLRKRIALAADCEITLEANPGAVDAQRFAAYRSAGVNRLSIGAQSFRSRQLEALGRIHGADEIDNAVAIARNAGFDNLNVDLMYGLPDDTIQGSIADLDRALALEPEHLSWYQLTLEPNTAFHRRPPALPDDALVAAIERAGRQRLEAHGFSRYEISAYAQPDRRCRHNLNYWQFGDYVGIGAGAHGKLTQPDAAIERRMRLRNPRSYQARAGTPDCVSVERITDPESIRLEFLMNALRLIEGVPQQLLTERTGLALEPMGAAVAAAVERGWLDRNAERLRATPQGLEALNRLLALFA
jgi:putative oxygen-independent coproporphyrinogen III oxidase